MSGAATRTQEDIRQWRYTYVLYFPAVRLGFESEAFFRTPDRKLLFYCIKLGFQLLFPEWENFLIRHCSLIVAQCIRENILQCSSELSCVEL
jgi:hypothetical protein